MAKIGTVKFITGTAKAVSANGVERILHTGDRVQLNDTVITTDSGSIVIAFNDGTRLDLGRDSQMLISRDNLATETRNNPEKLPAQTEQNAQKEVEAVQKALQDENYDPTKDLPATAVGAVAEGATDSVNHGHTFVNVDYLNPSTTPTSGFETTGIFSPPGQIPVEILILNPDAQAVLPPLIPPPPEPPVITVTGITSPTVTEGVSLAYTVTLSGNTNAVTTYNFTLGGGSASASDYGAPGFSNGVTYDPATGTITVPAGVSEFTVTVPTVDDSLIEPTETVPLTIGGVTSQGGILDNDQPGIDFIEPGAVGPGDDFVLEGVSLVYTVGLSENPLRPATYSFTLGGGSASASDYGAPGFSNGVSYDPATGTITVPAGVSEFTVTVPTVDDTLIEPTETVPLTIGGVTVEGGILDSDQPGIDFIEPGAVGPGDDFVLEGVSLIYTVGLIEESPIPVTYTFNLGGGTASVHDYGQPLFSDGVSYDATAGKITVPAGVSEFTVTVATINDGIAESSETVPLTIGNVTSIGGILENSDSLKAAKAFLFAADDSGKENAVTGDFNNGNRGDSLHLADLLQGEHSYVESLDHFLMFNDNAASQAAVISIDSDQLSQSHAQTSSMDLQNMDLTAANMLSNVDIINNLLVNSHLPVDA